MRYTLKLPVKEMLLCNLLLLSDGMYSDTMFLDPKSLQNKLFCVPYLSRHHGE